MTLYLFRFSVRVSKILQMLWSIRICKVLVRFSSVLNSLQSGFRFDCRFKAFLNRCNNKIVYFNLVYEELWSNKVFQFFIGSRICEPNRTEPNREPKKKTEPLRTLQCWFQKIETYIFQSGKWVWISMNTQYFRMVESANLFYTFWRVQKFWSGNQKFRSGP